MLNSPGRKAPFTKKHRPLLKCHEPLSQVLKYTSTESGIRLSLLKSTECKGTSCNASSTLLCLRTLEERCCREKNSLPLSISFDVRAQKNRLVTLTHHTNLQWFLIGESRSVSLFFHLQVISPNLPNVN